MKKMLLIPLLFAGFAAIQAQEADPVLLTVGKSEIRKSEFERIYRKNNPKGSANETSVDDYLGLFINFKLKVNEAMAEGLDTSQSFVTELKGYREQLAKPYLTDNEVTDHLIKEAFDRSQYDLVVSHMLVKLDRYPKPEDTLAAYKKAMQLYQRISGGKETFDQVASSVAADPNGPIIREDMTFTALSLVYNFETAAYNANVGEVTKPVRTRFGYHVILVREKRPALGQVKVAHILISVPKGAPKAVEDGAKMKIDEAYAKLKDGADFADLAREYSSDRNSAERGGNLPWFRTGRMVSEFEDATAKLAEIGDYSAPFRTNYGWHVIKLLDRKGVSDFETMLPELKEKISRDERSKISTHSRVAQIQQEYGFKENTKTIAPFRKLADQSIYEKKWNRDRANGLSEVMFTLGKQEYTQSDFADFIEQNQRMGPKNMQPADFINVLYHDFVEFSCLAYEDARLEQKYPEFRDLVNEYHDGILLFEMMDKKVWSRAVKDTSGLEAFYQEHKNDYMWGERADIEVYECSDKAGAENLRKILLKGEKKGIASSAAVEKANATIANSVLLKEKGKFQKDENGYMDRVAWSAGLSGNIEKGGKVYIVRVLGIDPPQPKSLKEAKGLVTAAYQDYLEKQWIEELKAKYPVTVHREVLKSVQ